MLRITESVQIPLPKKRQNRRRQRKHASGATVPRTRLKDPSNVRSTNPTSPLMMLSRLLSRLLLAMLRRLYVIAPAPAAITPAPAAGDVAPTVIAPAPAAITPAPAAGDAAPTVIAPAPAADDAEPTVITPAPAEATVIPTPPVPHRQRYAIGDNVNAKWKAKQFFLGHVINFNRGLYTVYFVEDGQVKKNLRDCDLRPYDGPCLRRCEMVNKCFYYFPGEDDCPSGIFKIRQLLTDKNVFRCIRMTGGGSKREGQLEDFDVGYVMRRYEQRQQQSRERGEGQILNSKRHR